MARGARRAHTDEQRAQQNTSDADLHESEPQPRTIAANPGHLLLKPHYEGYNAVLVRVSRIHPDALRDLLLMACRFVDATTKGRRTGRRPS